MILYRLRFLIWPILGQPTYRFVGLRVEENKMYHPLSRKVRRAVANITQQVSHETTWGSYTQGIFPGECRWKVKAGGNDWPLNPEEEVSITVTSPSGEVRIIGLEAVNEAIKANDEEYDAEAGHADARVHNEGDALRQVLEVLLAAAA